MYVGSVSCNYEINWLDLMVLVQSLEFLIYNMMSSEKRQFYFFLSNSNAFYFFFLPVASVLCWIGIVKSVFLIQVLEEKLPTFHHWVWCWLWVCHLWLLLCMFLLFLIWVFNHEWMLNFAKCFFYTYSFDFEPFFHPRAESYLIMVCDPFNVLNWVC